MSHTDDAARSEHGDRSATTRGEARASVHHIDRRYSERAQVEAALRESERRYRVLVE